MKNPILLLSVFILLTFSKSSYAQQERFIEFTISDTIVLKSTQIIYQINIGKQNELLGMKFGGEEENTEEELPTIKDVTNLLDKKKFKYTVISNKDYSISDKESKPSVEVTLANETELNKLYEVVKAEKGLTGKIKEVQYEDPSKYAQNAFKELYAKARKQADFMASVTGSKVKTLVSITDANKEAFDIMSIYKQLMKNMPKLAFGEAASFESEEVVKMVFKFSIE
ncbi:MAG: hypothetical protein K0R51_2650 [Cytophagaceae bacterium]|jgi:hypothetical protein|nr:hypothetical protein [Cytophagaceae bacterium]